MWCGGGGRGGRVVTSARLTLAIVVLSSRGTAPGNDLQKDRRAFGYTSTLWSSLVSRSWLDCSAGSRRFYVDRNFNQKTLAAAGRWRASLRTAMKYFQFYMNCEHMLVCVCNDLLFMLLPTRKLRRSRGIGWSCVWVEAFILPIIRVRQPNDGRVCWWGCVSRQECLSGCGFTLTSCKAARNVQVRVRAGRCAPTAHTSPLMTTWFV